MNTLHFTFLTVAVAASQAFGASVNSISPGDIPASATKITFETAPNGTPVLLGTPADGIWASIGVTFDSNDTVGTGGVFNITSPPNTLSGDSSAAFQPIHATFSPPVLLVGAWGFDFVLQIFDAQGNSLGTNTYTDGSPGLFGGANEYGFLGFKSTTPIATAEFRRAFPNDPFFGFHIDDLVYSTVPEPGTVTLLSIGAVVLIPFVWRRNRRARPTRV